MSSAEQRKEWISAKCVCMISQTRSVFIADGVLHKVGSITFKLLKTFCMEVTLSTAIQTISPCVCACACMRACVRACVCACVSVCVRVCVFLVSCTDMDGFH